jgi:hypothetical protein
MTTVNARTNRHGRESRRRRGRVVAIGCDTDALGKAFGDRTTHRVGTPMLRDVNAAWVRDNMSPKRLISVE